MNVILTAYFNTRPDPQRNYSWPPNDPTYMSLYQSVKRLKIETVIFHDHFSDKFMHRYKLDNVRFAYYEPTENLLNARLRCMYGWIRRHEEVDKVFCLDINDVVLYHNPFFLVRDEKKIYVGSEEMKIAKSGYVVNDFKDSYGKVYYPDNKILNCGIIGGYRERVLIVLGEMVRGFDVFNTEKNIDMAVFNKVVYDNFSDENIVTGKPLHTEFRAKFIDSLDQKKCYIKHK